MKFICLQLKEMQDEILTKNGEIKILRDSMQQMEYAMEEQKRSYMLLEQQKSQILSEKEKEFSKKVCNCVSYLQATCGSWFYDLIWQIPSQKKNSCVEFPNYICFLHLEESICKNLLQVFFCQNESKIQVVEVLIYFCLFVFLSNPKNIKIGMYFKVEKATEHAL